MKKTITPKYRIELSFISFIEKRIKKDSFVYSGKPTTKGAKQFRDDMNDSLEPGGSNEHLKPNQSAFGNSRIIHQKTGEVVAEYVPPAFEVIN